MMNTFRQHIPNFADGFKPKVFEFTDLDDLSNKLGVNKSLLVYNSGSILEVNEDETWWWCLGKVAHRVDGLRKWRGAPHDVIEIETMFGCGLDTFEPKTIGKRFQIRGDQIKMYSGFRGSTIGELKDGRSFVGTDAL